ncbi:hypothetical protein [Acetivibrio cellulolyticus]|uniref:hypothetical protein n=1 Tax=Acetivibrio cellulolyticus TaxID=35830 RepID=UPI0001E2FB23|nr:hypothetical protein [Acetivibrio cellulolyticus]
MSQYSNFEKFSGGISYFCISVGCGTIFKFVFNHIGTITKSQGLGSIAGITVVVLIFASIIRIQRSDNKQFQIKIKELQKERDAYAKVTFQLIKKEYNEKFYIAIEEDDFEALEKLIPPEEFLDGLKDGFVEFKKVHNNAKT